MKRKKYLKRATWICLCCKSILLSIVLLRKSPVHGVTITQISSFYLWGWRRSNTNSYSVLCLFLSIVARTPTRNSNVIHESFFWGGQVLLNRLLSNKLRRQCVAKSISLSHLLRFMVAHKCLTTIVYPAKVKEQHISQLYNWYNNNIECNVMALNAVWTHHLATDPSTAHTQQVYADCSFPGE